VKGESAICTTATQMFKCSNNNINQRELEARERMMNLNHFFDRSASGPVTMLSAYLPFEPSSSLFQQQFASLMPGAALSNMATMGSMNQINPPIIVNPQFLLSSPVAEFHRMATNPGPEFRSLMSSTGDQSAACGFPTNSFYDSNSMPTTENQARIMTSFRRLQPIGRANFTRTASDQCLPSNDRGTCRATKRTQSFADTDEEEIAPSTTMHKKLLLAAPAISLSGSLRGEKRLIVHFDSFGHRGLIPQRFGKSGYLIPDGLQGRHTLYHERWRFSITHGKPQGKEGEQPYVAITWTVIHEKTGTEHSRTETKEEASERVLNGRTVSNIVFREAFNAQVQSLMNLLKLDSSVRSRKKEELETQIRTLQPRCFNQGLLGFGLQHKIVQDQLGN